MTEPGLPGSAAPPLTAVYVGILTAVVVLGAFLFYADHYPVAPLDPADGRAHILAGGAGGTRNVLAITLMVGCLLSAVFLLGMGLANILLGRIQRRGIGASVLAGLLVGGTCVADAAKATWWLALPFPTAFLWLPVLPFLMFRRAPAPPHEPGSEPEPEPG